jgi:hypothetical protein
MPLVCFQPSRGLTEVILVLTDSRRFLLCRRGYILSVSSTSCPPFVPLSLRSTPDQIPYSHALSGEESVARTEGLRELEASWKLSGDVWKADDDDGGLTLDARPLQASIGILLAQAKAQVDKKEAKEILMQSLQAQHPLLQKTSEELGFLAKLHAETGASGIPPVPLKF